MRHLLLSYHTCPTEQPGQDLAGGMNVLLLGFLQATSWPTEVVTRSFGGHQQVALTPWVTLHRLPCGAERPWSREKALECLPAFDEAFSRWLQGRTFEVASAHYWMSATLLRHLSCPAGVVFHTLQAQKGPANGPLEEQRERVEAELARRYRCGFLHWHDMRNAGRHHPEIKGGVIRPGCSMPLRDEVRASAVPTVFGWAARRDGIKNFEEALTRLADLQEQFPQASLRVAGMEGEEGGGVSYLGPLLPDRMAEFYDSVDQLWNLSHYETFGLGVLEALTRGASVGLSEGSDWARRLRRLGVPTEPGQAWSQEQREKALRLAAAYRWEKAMPGWERWLRSLSRDKVKGGI